MWNLTVKKIGKNFKKFNLLIESTIYLICAFQLIQLIIDYTKYEMNNEYRAKDHLKDITFTFCIEPDNLFFIRAYLKIDEQKLDKKNALFNSNRNFRGNYCYTYNTIENYTNKFDSKTQSRTAKTSLFGFHNYPFKITIIGHLSKVPSHFGKIYIVKPKKLKLTRYNIQSEYSMRRLLPWPFEHNCYDYDSPTSKFKSREYCYLDIMRKLELKYCKVNKYWTVNVKYEKNITQCIKPNFILLNKLCKINCLDISTDYTFVKNDVFDYTLNKMRHYTLIIVFHDDIKRRLYLEYSPKFTKIQLFSTLGGLLGMWLGVTINNLVIIFIELIYKVYSRLNILVPTFSIRKIKFYLTSIILILLTLNLWQLIIQFSSGHTITKIDIVNDVDWPFFSIAERLNILDKTCEPFLNQMFTNYTNLTQIIFNYYKQDKIYNGKYKNFHEFKKELILEYGYEYFQNIYPESLGILSCTIINKNNNLINCKNIIKIILQIKELEILTLYRFSISSLHQKIDKNSIKKIIIFLNGEKCFVKTLLIREDNIDRYKFFFTSGLEMSIKFQKTLLLKSFSSLNKECISMIENKFYDINDCRMKFTNNYLINKLKFNCMPRDRIEFYNDDLKLFGNKFCHRNNSNQSYSTGNFEMFINQNCPLPCENEFLSIECKQKKFSDDKIKINIIPKSNLKPIFTHSLSMDYNNFIYDLGGTIGMWIGWSALTIPIYIYENFKKLNVQIFRYYSLKIWKIMFIVLNYLSIKSILFFKYLINLFQSYKNINLFSCILKIG